MVVDPITIVLLCLAAASAGWVDAISGGGGLLQLPALLVALPGTSPALLFGTNKLSGIIGTSGAAVAYLRQVKPDLRTALPMAAAAFAGSGIGATFASRIPVNAFRPLILVLLIGVWFWTLAMPKLGQSQILRWHGQRRHYVIAAFAGFFIGLYDGLLGPGTGSFLLIVLVGVLGYSFLQASATAKIVNVGTNAAALIVFGLTGSVIWLLGLLMGLCNLTGAVIGARTAINRGSGFVRAVFLVVVAILIARLAWTYT
ncbi:MAG: TSUP family transporter [Actinomycetes bacterium]